MIGAEGTLFRTKTGELSVARSACALLTKSLRPLPDKWHGMADTEIALPAALRRSDRQQGQPARVRNALAHHPLLARFAGFGRLSRGRDADAADDPGRRRRAAVQDPPQRARHGHVPAHRARVVPEAPDGRRVRPGLRDQQQFPQRGFVDAAQPGVHHARAVSGIRRLHRRHAHRREHVPGNRRRADRLAQDRLPGFRVRPRRVIRAIDDRGDPAREQPGSRPRRCCATSPICGGFATR